MRRWKTPWLGAAAVACTGAAPPAPAAPCPTASASATASPTASVLLDRTNRKSRGEVPLTGGTGDVILRALDSSGRERWAWAWKRIDAHAPDGQGGAFVAGSSDVGEVIGHIDRQGSLAWARPAEPQPGSRQQLAAGPASITWAYQVHGRNVIAFLGRDGTPRQRWQPTEPCVHVGSDATVTLSDRVGHLRHHQPNGAMVWAADAFIRASDPSAGPDSCPVLRSCPDGALLAGAPDGTLTAFDAKGARRWQLGMRDAIATIDQQADGSLLAHAKDFSSLPVDSSCSEPDISSIAVVQSVLSAATVPLTHPLVFRKELTGPIGAVALASSDRVVALRDDVVHQWKAGAHTTVPVPQPTRREVFFRGAPADQGWFEEYRVAVGPTGRPWIVGLRRTGGEVPGTYRLSALRAIEQTRAGWTALGELQKSFWRTRIDHPPVVSTGPGDKVVCGNAACARWHGGTWEQLPVIANDPIRAVHSTPTSVWVVGVDHVASWRSGTWRTYPSVSTGRWTAIWATSDTDVWVGGKCGSEQGLPVCELLHHDGTSWARVPSPVGYVRGLWASAPDDVWAAGHEGVARFDGRSWSRVLGVHGDCFSVTGSGGSEVWIGAESGLWHGVPLAEGDGPTQPTNLQLRRAAQADRPATRIDALAPDPSWRGERTVLPQAEGEGLDHALSVACAPDNTLWLADEDGVLSYDGRQVRRRAADHRSSWLIAHDALAPVDGGRGWAIGTDGLMEVGPDGSTPSAHQIPGIAAVSLSSAGSLWAVSSWPGRGYPRVLARIDSRWRYLQAIPEATYVAVSASGARDVWIAGGVGKSANASRPWPAGQGILLHGSARSYTWYPIPQGSLLSVAATGPEEAWAAGAAGLIVQVRRGALAVHQLAEQTWLRAVAARSPGDVWFAGDDATLLWCDGSTFTRVPVAGLGRDSALASVATCPNGEVWAVGPTAIIRVTRARGLPGAGSAQ